MNEETSKKNLSRRQFLKGALVAGGAGVSAGALAGCQPKVVEQPGAAATAAPGAAKTWSWEAKPAPIAAGDIKKTVDADVLVIGAGLAGLCAALAAKEAGAKVVVIDKNETPGFRGGHITAFNSKVHKDMKIDVNYRQIVRDWVAWAQGRLKEDLLWEFAHKSGASMDWVIEKVEPQGIEVFLWGEFYPGPDYTEYPVTHIFREKAKPENVGNAALVPALENSAKQAGIQIDYKTPAVQLVREGEGPVKGAIAGVKGNYVQYNAKNTIIASGDYASNKEMVERFDPFALKADAQIYFPNKCNTGDGHVMAMQAGAAMQQVEPHAAVIHLEAGAASYGFLHVNAEGKRFKNEDVNTQSKSCTKEYQPQGIAWTIYDADGLNQVKQQVDAGVGGGLFYGQTFAKMGEKFDLEAEKKQLEQHIKDGKVVTADTLEELAKKMEVPADALVATVKRYNELVAAGDDPDFGKRKELLTAVAKAPFYAGKLFSTVLTMSGGLRTNTKAQVLDDAEKPIEGLFVAGAAAGDFFANDYPTICPGIGHGRCITFGRIAGIVAAGKNPDDIIPSLKL